VASAWKSVPNPLPANGYDDSRIDQARQGLTPLAMALIDLNTSAHYVHFLFVKMSVANVAVIVLMIAVFVAAILLPFPGHDRDG
jgi:hypothetical protein